MSYTPFGPNNRNNVRAQARQGRMLAAAEKHRLVEDGRRGDAAYRDDVTVDDAEGGPSWWSRLAGRSSRREDGAR